MDEPLQDELLEANGGHVLVEHLDDLQLFLLLEAPYNVLAVEQVATVGEEREDADAQANAEDDHGVGGVFGFELL